MQERQKNFRHKASMLSMPPGPKSLENLSRVSKSVGRSNLAGLFGVTLAAGSGAYVKDVDGNEYLDCLAGASVNILGYGNKDVLNAYYATASEMQHTCTPYSANLQMADIAEALINTFPCSREIDTDRLVLFGLTGSDGIGGALSATRKFTQRFAIMYFKNAYHGSTGLSQQASGFTALKTGIYTPSEDFIALEFPTDESSAQRVLHEMRSHLETGRVGGLVSEPIQGDGGVNIAPKNFFQDVKTLLAHYGALLIVDEVQSGMGRTGKWWSIEHEGVTPDLLVSAKGLAAGFAPISALLGPTKIINSLESAQQVFSFSAHGPACAAALATIKVIQENNLIANAAKQGKLLIDGLNAVQAQFPNVIKQVRGRGLMIGIEINTALNSFAAKLFATRGVELGIYFGFFGDSNQVVRIEPPLIITESDVRSIIDVTHRVAQEFENDTVPEITYRNTMIYAGGL